MNWKRELSRTGDRDLPHVGNQHAEFESVSMWTVIHLHLSYDGACEGSKLGQLASSDERGRRHGNHIDHSSRCVFARRRGLGILPVAQELAPS
jgi:hypothetical protein